MTDLIGVIYGDNTTTITLPTGSFWLLTVLTLGGLYWYVISVREWLDEIIRYVLRRRA